MRQRWQVGDLGTEELQELEVHIDWLRFLAFSGSAVISLCLWAGIIEAVRIVWR